MSKKVWFILIIGLVVVAGISYGFLSTTEIETEKPVTQTQQKQDQEYPDAPDFALQDLNGNIVKLSDYKGKVVIIDFWATWCGPCRRGIPEFVALQSEYGEDKLAILGVSVDQGDLSVVPKFAKNYEINYPVLYANEDIQRKYGPIRSIPTAFIVDRSGKVRDLAIGLRPKSYFKNQIDSLL
ncbi:MAG: redoxin domain-containing protein [Calditrichia bacterium]|nr:redoxin domain-containing protein [Calditrichia bacterium]